MAFPARVLGVSPEGATSDSDFQSCCFHLPKCSMDYARTQKNFQKRGQKARECPREGRLGRRAAACAGAPPGDTLRLPAERCCVHSVLQIIERRCRKRKPLAQGTSAQGADWRPLPGRPPKVPWPPCRVSLRLLSGAAGRVGSGQSRGLHGAAHATCLTRRRPGTRRVPEASRFLPSRTGLLWLVPGPHVPTCSLQHPPPRDTQLAHSSIQLMVSAVLF